jgi:hypothetical protein
MKIQREGLLKVRTKLRSCQVVHGLMTILDIIDTYMMSVESHMQRKIDVLLTYNYWFARFQTYVCHKRLRTLASFFVFWYLWQ